jgi:AcrR family transcriptional regulator
MNPTTRDRLIHAASQLFASQGYRGAPVRDICNLARTNPGAVSYHFGGKRQLYRTVLRQAAERLAAAALGDEREENINDVDLLAMSRRIFGQIHDDPAASQLLLRDLAEGGAVAVEALEPALRSALDALSRWVGHSDTPRASSEVRTLFLELAAPLFLVTAAWPLVARPLELDEAERDRLLETMIHRVLAGRASPTGSMF